MSSQIQRLTELFHDTRDSKGYSNTSKWYDGLSKAISFLKRAEADHDPFDRFWNAWSSVYNLFTQYGKPGDEEFKMLNSWVSDIQEIPAVRNIFDMRGGQIDISEFLNKIKAARRSLLKTQGEQALTAWKPGVTVSAKACRYFFNIVQDVRNRKAHPDFNPSNPKVQKALTALADCLTPIATEAIEVMIERPVPGTTGRVPIRHFFLWPFLNNADGFLSDYYLERLFPDEELATFPEDDAKLKLKELRKAFRDKREELNAADIQETSKLWCEPVLFPLLNTKPVRGISLVGEGIVQPAFVMAKSGFVGALKKEYYGKETADHIACLIWVLPWAASLDAILEDPTGTLLPALEMANRTLTISDIPWAVMTNGRQLRLLSRQTAHKPRCFLEIDLEATCDITRDQEDCLKAFRYSLGLFSGDGFTEEDDKGATRLERIRVGSERHGKEIGDELKQNVFRALDELGDGFLHYLRVKPDEFSVWCKEKGLDGSTEDCLSSDSLLADVYHESLSLMYRLLFLFYAESRDLLPLHDETYQETYSLESIRNEVIAVHDDPDRSKRFFGKGDTFLWRQLQELFRLVHEGWGSIVPAYNGGLFDPERHPFLERFEVPDYFLAKAIDFLSRSQPSSGQNRGEGRRKVTYRDLDVRHLGTIYEGILEYHAQIATEDLVVVRRGTGVKAQEEYVTADQLTSKEKQDLGVYLQAVEDEPHYPRLPRTIRVRDLKEKGSYFLVYGGRESKRKSSGSYYTPDYIVQYIIDKTLAPLVRGECRPQPDSISEELKKIGFHEEQHLERPLSSDEILDLKILDPAMGSGHFLVAATEFLAKAYGEALIREGKDEDGTLTDEEFSRYKRVIAERCIYGVDINPMAVELAKLSMWLFTMDKARPLSFIDHHFKCGNSLIGTWMEDLIHETPTDSLRASSLKTRQHTKQMNLFEQRLRSKVPIIMGDIFNILQKETLAISDITHKKSLDKAIDEIRRPFVNVSDIYTARFFGEISPNFYSLVSDLENARHYHSEVAQNYSFFHWELEFPEVFYNKYGQKKHDRGFHAIVGNPPWGANFDKYELAYHRNFNKEIIVSSTVVSFSPFVQAELTGPEHGWFRDS